MILWAILPKIFENFAFQVAPGLEDCLHEVI